MNVAGAGVVDGGLGRGTGPPPVVPPFRLDIDEELFRIPFAHERRRLRRFEAGVLLDLHLRRLARLSGAVDRALALRLRRLRERRGHVRLGYARFADYACDRLGISVRLAQELVRLGKALQRLPALDRALKEGRITWSAAVQVARVAGIEDEARWVELAGRVSVRDLTKRVGAALSGGAGESGGSSEGAGGRGACDHDPDGADGGETVAEEEDDPLMQLSLWVRGGTARLWYAARKLCEMVAGGGSARVRSPSTCWPICCRDCAMRRTAI